MARKPKPIAPWQITKIHIAANQLGLIDKNSKSDNYRQILSGFISKDGKQSSSCKDLNFDQANELLALFERLGFTAKKANENEYKKKFKNNRGNNFATPKQLGLIRGLWEERSRNKSPESLNKFIKNIVKIDDITWLKKGHVSKVIKAIENL